MTSYVALTEGALIGRFQLGEELGSGAVGTVYAAYDEATGERVAVKELRRPRASAVESLRRELEVLHDHQHPNVVGVRELIEHGRHWLLVLELVPGTDLLSWVRYGPKAIANATRAPAVPMPGAANDEGADQTLMRLRAAYCQLAEGLRWLHRHDLVHRDIKPSNVRVTPEGRVVIIDFGLAMLKPNSRRPKTTSAPPRPEAAPVADGSSMSRTVGTPWYMAPEQASALTIGPPADWYAAGVVLYEALAGRLPFSGGGYEVMRKKLRFSPAPIETYNPQAPRDLVRLCDALLSIAPEDRPGAREVLATCGQTGDTVHSLPAPQAARVLGRKKELHTLSTVADAVRDTFHTVLIDGPSGIGKTALVDRFVARQQRESTRLVLRGRCYERETATYKGLDQVMSQLALYIEGDSDTFSPQLLRGCERASRLFPVLAGGEIPPTGRASTADATAMRQEAFEAVILLLRRVSRAVRLTLVVEDVQWADVETLRILEALRDAKGIGALLLATCRPAPELGEEHRGRLEALFAGEGTHRVTLGSLEPDTAAALVRTCVGDHLPAAVQNRIVEQAEGHPLFIIELSKYVCEQRLTSIGDVDLHEVLSSKLRGLSILANRAMQVLALARRPVPLRRLARILQVEHGSLGPEVQHLRQADLAGMGTAGRVYCTHDRIARTVVQGMPPEVTTRWHERIATTLEHEQSVEAGLILEHWEAAGRPDGVMRWLPTAAENAMRGLAFERAADLGQRAVRMLGDEVGAAKAKQVHLICAEALSCAGRSEEAARSYMAAVEHCGPEAVAELQVRAAQQLLQAGLYTEGMGAARSVFADQQIPVANGDLGALASLMWRRASLACRGLDSNELAEPPDSKAGQRLDTMWRLLQPLTWYDMVLGGSLTAKYVYDSLESGAPEHVARALAQEASFRAVERPEDPQTYEPLLVRSAQLAERGGDSETRAWVALCRGQAASLRFDLESARADLRNAERLFRRDCAHAPWQHTLARVLLLGAEFNAGNHAEVRDRGRAWMKDAQARGDRFAEARLSGLGLCSTRWIMEGQPGRALAEIDELEAVLPDGSFGLAHLGLLSARSYALAYSDPGRLASYLAVHKVDFGRAIVFKTRFGKDFLMALMGWAELAAACETEGRERASHLRQAARHIRRMQRGRAAAWQAAALTLSAQVQLLHGDVDQALAQASSAVEKYRSMGSALHAPCAEYLAGALEGGVSGAARCDEVVARYRQQGWARPRQWLEAITPALRLLPRTLA